MLIGVCGSNLYLSECRRLAATSRRGGRGWDGTIQTSLLWTVRSGRSASWEDQWFQRSSGPSAHLSRSALKFVPRLRWMLTVTVQHHRQLQPQSNKTGPRTFRFLLRWKVSVRCYSSSTLKVMSSCEGKRATEGKRERPIVAGKRRTRVSGRFLSWFKSVSNGRGSISEAMSPAISRPKSLQNTSHSLRRSFDFLLPPPFSFAVDSNSLTQVLSSLLLLLLLLPLLFLLLFFQRMWETPRHADCLSTNPPFPYWLHAYGP